jgi:predicted nucleic acid-binding protein
LAIAGVANGYGIIYDTTVERRWTVVLDTNVLEAAVRSQRGASYAVLSRVGKGLFDVAVSVPVVLEYEEVLTRSRTGRSRRIAQDVIDYVCAVAKPQPIFFLWRPRLSDPDDDMVLELAVAAGCDAIITFNRRHFEPTTAGFGIRVLAPAEFLEELGEA